MRRDIIETKNRVRDLYLAWPERGISHAGKSMIFQSYLRSQSDFSYMRFGAEGIHQAVTAWIDEWDRLF